IMPGYNVHRIFNYLLFITIVALLYVWKIPVISLKQLLVFVAGFYIGTDFITPDLDIESTAMKRWGKLKILWLPYKWIFKHGQSSHNIVYGAVVRILYISLIILGVYYLLFKSLPPETMFSSIHVFIFLSGIIIANALHVILDSLF
ncbi:MAG: DUF2227 family putative metal-binding protein, partial [Candidatus Methanoperedens sp.]|nr:DUF2227 family putative metal-binding protein [Candidatus Methanoperedens sp.]